MALQAIETGKSVELCVDFVHVVGIRDHAAGDLGPPLRVKVVYVQDYPLVTCFFHFCRNYKQLIIRKGQF